MKALLFLLVFGGQAILFDAHSQELPDPQEVRKMAVEDKVKIYNKLLDGPSSYSNEDIVKLLSYGLKDNEVQIRELSLATVFWASMSKAAKKTDIDFTQIPNLREELISATKTKDFQISSMAMQSLAMIYPTDEIVEGFLLEYFRKAEESDQKSVALKSLGLGNYTSAETQRANLESLTGNDQVLSELAAHYATKHKIPEALPLLVNNLSKADGYNLETYVNAIAAYGKLASSHVGSLKSLMNKTADNPSLKSSIGEAIEKIQSTE